ncbi:93L [Yaba monkey tumor virus]|uniref:93L n=1 Tax=Yaba monkey tumor virus (strain VR587) TaxID=928314 RepID=Q6TUS5_YMTV5|nr:93L [Yaba monkey tumor virus]AAR07449.1 93L [Yaba monkey tumor virus]
MSWHLKYNVVLDEPKKCSKCFSNLFEYIVQDSETMKIMLEDQPKKLQTLKRFLSATRNKHFTYKILDEEIRRVLT